MVKRNWIILVAAVIIAVVAAFFYSVYRSTPTLNWAPNYKEQSDAPYGSSLLYRLMNTMERTGRFTTLRDPVSFHRRFNDPENRNSLYFYLGKTFQPDSSVAESLVSFAERGNTVFIAAEEISTDLIQTMNRRAGVYQDLNALLTASITAHAIYPNLLHPQMVLKDTIRIQYRLFDYFIPFSASAVDTGMLTQIGVHHAFIRQGTFRTGSAGSQTNFIGVRCGKGIIHFYTTPLVMTNYHLKTQSVFNYCTRLFYGVKPGDIYWQKPEFLNAVSPESTPERSGPFDVLLSYRSFRYAWYVILAGVAVFILSGIRRLQRKVPVMPGNRNQSVEFARTIARLYLSEKDHLQMALKKRRYFYNLIRNRYRLNLNEDSPELRIMLKERSRADEGVVHHLMEECSALEHKQRLTDREFREFIDLLQSFQKEYVVMKAV